MDGLLIRDARRADLDAIAAIYNEAIAEGFSTFETEPRTAADIEAWLGAARHPVLVARDGETVAGWARLAPYSTRACYAGIVEASVYVSTSSRGRGIGNALASALRERAQQAGLTKLLGKCLTINTAAARLVVRHGFREVGVHRRHGQIDGRWYDVLLVELLLGEESVGEPEPTVHRAKVVWDGDRRDLRAHTIELAGQRLAGSAMADLGGDPEKADPEELFVASLAACHMLWFLDFARRERLRVLSYEDRPEGTMDGVRFVDVVLRPRVTFASATDVPSDALARLHERAHEACFIANSVSCAVRVVGRRDP